MSWDRIEGQWKQRRGQAVHKWGKVMNDELAAIAGKYEELVGRLQEKYGVAKEETKQHIIQYRATVELLKASNSKLMELQQTLSKLAADRGQAAPSEKSTVEPAAVKKASVKHTQPPTKHARVKPAAASPKKRSTTSSKG